MRSRLLLVPTWAQPYKLGRSQQVFEAEKPDHKYLAAAKMWGYSGQQHLRWRVYLYHPKLMEQAKVIHAAFIRGLRKSLFLSSSCIYPRLKIQPTAEDALLISLLDHSNESYAIASIAGLKLCKNYNSQSSQTHGIYYRSLIAANLDSHVDSYHPNF